MALSVGQVSAARRVVRVSLLGVIGLNDSLDNLLETSNGNLQQLHQQIDEVVALLGAAKNSLVEVAPPAAAAPVAEAPAATAVPAAS